MVVKDSKRRLRVLLVDDSVDRRDAIEQALLSVGCEVIGLALGSDDLLSCVERSDPDVVVIDTESPGRDTLQSVHSLQDASPRPIVMFTQDDDGRTIARATRAGVSAYVVDGIGRKCVRPILAAAIERFRQYHRLKNELDRTRAQLEDRKVIDKAKGILMQKRGMTEDEAYRAIRSLAMSSNKKVAEVADGIVSAASLLI